MSRFSDALELVQGVVNMHQDSERVTEGSPAEIQDLQCCSGEAISIAPASRQTNFRKHRFNQESPQNMAGNPSGRHPIIGDDEARLDAGLRYTDLLEATYNEVSALRNLTSEGQMDGGNNTERRSAGNGSGAIPTSSPSDVQPIVTATFELAGKTAFEPDDGVVVRIGSDFIPSAKPFGLPDGPDCSVHGVPGDWSPASSPTLSADSKTGALGNQAAFVQTPAEGLRASPGASRFAGIRNLRRDQGRFPLQAGESRSIPLHEEMVGRMKAGAEAQPAIDGTCTRTEEQMFEEQEQDEKAGIFSEKSRIQPSFQSGMNLEGTTLDSGEGTCGSTATGSSEYDGRKPRLRSRSSILTLSQENANFWRETSKRKLEERMHSEMRGRSKLGDVVTKTSSNYRFVSQLIHGIRSTILGSDVVEGEAAQLGPEDFDRFTKIEFVLDGQQKCKFKDYAPSVFRQLRHMFGVDDEAYLNSVGQREGMAEISTEDTGSKSGQKFLISHDGRYFMKTATASEARFFMKILPHYYRHMKVHRNSLLCRFFGVYRLKPGRLHVLVMANVFDTERVVHQRFDLKGSLIGRKVSEAQRQGPAVILKDLDFLLEGKFMNLGPERKSILMAQVKSDSSFLRSLGVMDYSLLLGVHFRNAGGADAGHATSRIAADADAINSFRSINEKGRLVRTWSLESCMPDETHVSDFQVHDGGLASQNTTRQGIRTTGGDIYFVGIIDYLQCYNARKRCETFFKGFRYNLSGISSVNPRFYSKRFCDFMTSLME